MSIKIYNEIVIDMNPESSSYEDILYEDSFEHEGDIMLMQGEENSSRSIGAPKRKYKYYDHHEKKDKYADHRMDILSAYRDSIEEVYVHDLYDFNEESQQWVLTGEGEKTPDHLDNMPAGGDTDTTDWGAQELTKDTFINADGTPKPRQEIYDTLDPMLPGITGQALDDFIRTQMPKYTGDEEDIKFLEKDKEFAEESARQTYDTNIANLQSSAKGIGSLPSTGAGIRAEMEGKKDIAKGFEGYTDAYGLAKKRAETTFDKGIYGLGEDYASSVIGSFQPTFFQQPTVGSTITPYYKVKAESGGKVPSKETFLDFLTSLPDAGGS